MGDAMIIDPNNDESPFGINEIHVRKTYVRETGPGKQQLIQQFTKVKDGTSIFMYPTSMPFPGSGGMIRMNVNLPAKTIEEAFEMIEETVKKAVEAFAKEVSGKIVIPTNPGAVLKE